MPDPRDRDRYDDLGYRDGRPPASGDDLRPEYVDHDDYDYDYDMADLERLWSGDGHVPESPPHGMRPDLRVRGQDGPDGRRVEVRPGVPRRPATPRDDDREPGEDPRTGPQRPDAAHLLRADGRSARTTDRPLTPRRYVPEQSPRRERVLRPAVQPPAARRPHGHEDDRPEASPPQSRRQAREAREASEACAERRVRAGGDPGSGAPTVARGLAASGGGRLSSHLQRLGHRVRTWYRADDDLDPGTAGDGVRRRQFLGTAVAVVAGVGLAAEGYHLVSQVGPGEESPPGAAAAAADQSLIVGFGEIDHQHGLIGRLVNRLEDTMNRQDPRDVQARALTDLASEVQVHFAFEESLMRTYHLVDMSGHIARHAAFLKTVSDVIGQFRAGRADVTPGLISMIRSWLRDHITHDDTRLAQQLNADGVPSAV